MEPISDERLKEIRKLFALVADTMRIMYSDGANPQQELVNLCDELQQRREADAVWKRVRDALKELCDGIEDGEGCDSNGDVFDLTEAVAALAAVSALPKVEGAADGQ